MKDPKERRFEISCIPSSNAYGNPWRRRIWVCDEIPGRIARRGEVCRQGSGGGAYTVEVVDFQAVR